MSARFKLLLIGGLAILVVYGAYVYIVGLAYSTPEVKMVPLGGRWEAENTRWLGGTTWGHTALYRRTANGRELTCPIVFKEIYVGDDCVVYATSSSCWIACDDREPIVIVRDGCDRWEVLEGQFRRLQSTATGLMATSIFELEDLKARAKAP